MENKHSTQADLLLLAVTIIAAGGWIFSVEAMKELPPLMFIGIRFLTASAFIAVFYPKQLRELSIPALKTSIFVGLCFSIAITFWVQGLYHTEHVGEGAFITSLAVVLVPIFAALIFKERPSTSTWIALPIAATGLALLALDENLNFHMEAAQINFVIAAVLFSLHFNLITYAANKIPAAALTVIPLAVVGVISLIISLFTEQWPESVSWTAWGWLMASALIATSLRFLIQTYAQGLTPASHAAIILIVEPVWTSITAALWFGESMIFSQLLGCGLIFTSLIINRWNWVTELLHQSKKRLFISPKKPLVEKK